MGNKKFNYKTNNVSLRKMSKIYPYKNSIYATVYFHIMNHEYEQEELDDMLEEYYNKYSEKSKDDISDIDNDLNDDFVCEFESESDYDTDNEDDDSYNNEDYNDDEDEEEYLDSLYEEYAEDVLEYMNDQLLCDIVIGYKIGYGADFDSTEEVLNETDRSKFRVIIAGIKFSNEIDEKLLDNFKSIIVTDESFYTSYNDIRKKNTDIVNEALHDNETAIQNLTSTAIGVIVKYLNEYGVYEDDTDTVSDVIDLDLDEDRKASIQRNMDGLFFNIHRFKLHLDLNSYDINSEILNKTLDEVYGSVLRFNNAINIISGVAKKMEIFKYDDNKKSCIFIKNDSGGTYLFLDGYNSK